jgi:hypothetical protein
MKFFLKFILAPLIILGIGICIGIFVRDFPQFTLDHNVRLIEVLKLLTTIGIGIFIPLLVKKLIEDKRSFKNSLIEEVGSFNKIAERINERVVAVHGSKKLTQRDKDDFVLLFEIGDEEFNQLCDFITEHCNTEINALITKLKDKHIEYWKTLTGSEITKSTVKVIDDATFKKASKQFTEIKQITRKIKASINQM